MTTYGPHNDNEFFEKIKDIILAIDIPESMKMNNSCNNKYDYSIENNYEDEYNYEDEDEEEDSYKISYENEEDEFIYNECDNDNEDNIFLTEELSFNSTYKVLNYIEKNGICMTKKEFKNYFDKWIKNYPDLKDMYLNILKLDFFTTKEIIVNKTDKEKVLKQSIKNKIDNEKIIPPKRK